MRISDWSSDVCSSDLAVERDPGQAVLRDLEARAGVAHLLAKHRRLGDGEAQVANNHNRGGIRQRSVQRGYGFGLFSTIHACFSTLARRRAEKRHRAADLKSTRLNSSH